MNKDNKNYNILVIEDNIGDYYLLEEYLNENIEKPNIKHLERFSELKQISDNTKDFDVIFLDTSLPDKSGEELVTEVLQITKNIPVIVLTGYSDQSFATKTIQLGASDFILKDQLSSENIHKSILTNIERFKKKAFVKI
ncbi:MAG: response regulator [Flavobacterium sp.]|nr:response regulator [Flavobacterium sp.]